MIGQHMMTRRLLFRTGVGKKRNPLNALELGPEDAKDYVRPEIALICDRTGRYPYPIEECWRGVEKGYYKYLGYRGNRVKVEHYFEHTVGRHRAL